MYRRVKKCVMGCWVALFLASIHSIAQAGDCPIIFLHGHTSGWKYWYSSSPDTEKYHVDYTVMKKILNEAYQGYTAGEPLNCFENTSLAPTGGQKKKIYNFQYYHPDPNQQAGWSRDISGAIGSNGYCYPADPLAEIAYRNSLAGGSWAQALATFIDKVLEATGATKVDIVAHSMGGLVARAAIKWYGCASKVRKLLMIATPNQGIHGPSPWSNWSQIGIPGWMEAGENLEMDGAVLFYKYSDPNVKKTWTEFLNEGDWAQGVRYATISGNLDPYIVPSNEDGIVNHEWVALSGADFNASGIYAAHGSSEGNWLKFATKGELSLTTCTYTEEFIKNWMIDDNTTHNGATVTGSFNLYDEVPFDDTWDKYELRVRLPIDDYNKTLSTYLEFWDMTPRLRYYAAFPSYKYTKGCPGDKVLSIIPNLSIGTWLIKTRVNDMDGEVYQGSELIAVSTNLPETCRVVITKPVAGDVFTVQSPYDKLTVNVKCNFYMAQNFTIYFSPYEAGDPTPVYTATNYYGGGETKTIQFAMPQVNSPYCRVFVRAWLDNFIKVDDISDYFTIRLDAPYDLYCFEKDESKVGLDWRCGTLLNFEVWRMKSGESWQMIAQGYWGPGSKSFYDETVERNTTYYYKVRSYGIFQGQKFYSDFCAPISVTTPLLNAPYHELRVHSPASDRIIVQFQDKSNYETNFEVWRRCPPTGEPWHIETTLPAEPSSGNWVTWIDYNVKPESTYLYRVRAYTSTPPAGHSAYTLVYGATVAPHLKTSRDSATAYQPKVLYDHDNYLYYMAYGLESLLVASRSTDGLSWEGPITACYWGQEMYETDAGFCQLDIRLSTPHFFLPL